MMSGISEEDKTQDQGVCARSAYVCVYIYTMKTHQIRCPHIALALARWSAWWLLLWRRGDGPADLWSRSPAQSARVQNQTFGGTCTRTRKHKRCPRASFLLHANILVTDEWKKTTWTQSLTFQWCHRRLSWCKRSFLDPAVPETTTASHLRVDRQIKEREGVWRKEIFSSQPVLYV